MNLILCQEKTEGREKIISSAFSSAGSAFICYLDLLDSFNLAHYPADIRQTSLPAGVLSGTLTGPHFLFRHDSFHYGGTSVLYEILFDVFICIIKAVADKITHVLILSLQASHIPFS
jgi:hypothetical protein